MAKQQKNQADAGDKSDDTQAAATAPEAAAPVAAEHAEPAATAPAPAKDPVPATAATAGGLHAEVQAAVKTADEAGDHAAHAALSGIETVLVELRMKLVNFEHVVHDDVQAIIAKIKAFL